MSWLKDLEAALDERLGTRRLLHEALEEPVPGGASWAYVLGSATLIVFGVQVVTGLVLAMYYSPSATDAWASVAYLEREVTMGSVVRGLHHHAAGAMVALAVLHLLQVAIFGAYKRPREANWLSGLGLLGLVLAFALTGYLLPWDQTGYWATKVATSIAGTLPVIGPMAQTVAQGGNDYGSLTLTRFYALHVILLPLATGGLIGVHLALFRKHGITPHPGKSEAVLAQRVEPFWPKQVFFDAVFGAVVIAGLIYAALKIGAPLEAPADPASNFIARPEWYFLFLFQLLKYFDGPLQVVGTVVIPGAAGAFLALLPFLDRGPSRRFRDRKIFLAALGGGLAGIGALTGLALRHDRHDPTIHAQKLVAKRESDRAKALAAAGVPPAGAADMMSHDPLTRGERVFAKECASCHALEGQNPKEPKGPELTAYGSKAWILQVLRDPDSHRLYGRTKAEGMKSFAQLPAADLEKLVDFLYERRRPDAPPVEGHPAEALIEAAECGNCHDFEEAYGLEGPALFKYGSAEWVLGMINDPGASHLYGEMNDMPAFERRLSDEDRQALVAFLASLEARANRQAWPYVNDEGPVPTPRTKTGKTAPPGESPPPSEGPPPDSDR
jgi:ubiquinol-cytochrome c reductase cytochrome b subunit